MKELDFDELDRAVTSLMGGVQKKAAPAPTGSDMTILEVPTTMSPVGDDATRAVAPSVPPVQQIAGDVATPTTVAPSTIDTPNVPSRESQSSAPLATRRSGRFMDVVHPSSDMKTTDMTPSAQPSRQGVTIDPVVSAPSAPADTSASAEEVSSPAAAGAASEAMVSHDWPDPLQGYGTEPATVAPEVTSDDVSRNDGVEDEADPVPVSDTEPLTTPFLSDAKVDKRPLGGLAPAETSVELTAPDAPLATDSSSDEPGRAPVLGALAGEDLTQHDPDDQLPPNVDVITHSSLPEELQGDLLTIESGAATEAVKEPASVPASVPAATVVLAPAVPTLAPSGPSSIQPQYKEEKSTGDQTNGSIYDTRGYHQPLAHPEKKKSGWLWIVWVIIILIAGAGSGAALYLLKVI